MHFRDVAHVDGWRCAASAAREKRTRRWVGAAPTGMGTRGKVAGEVSGSGAVGRLGERAPTGRVPCVRRIAV
jgi:hypothetical protein